MSIFIHCHVAFSTLYSIFVVILTCGIDINVGITSVTLWYCIKMAVHVIKFSPPDTPISLQSSELNWPYRILMVGSSTGEGLNAGGIRILIEVLTVVSEMLKDPYLR